MNALMLLLDQAEFAVLAAGAVFVRISALVFFLPGFGERIIPMRVKLGVALAFTAVVWPLASVYSPPEMEMTLESVGLVYTAEAFNGALMGLGLRFMIFALQTAGMLIAQNLSLAMMLGPGVAPEPEATIGTILSLAGIALALSLGLHIKVAALLAESYAVLPFGGFPIGSDVAEWSAARAAKAFNLAVSLSLPFLIAGFIYNVALGVINRAMPQMMVAFIGLPAITGLGLALLCATAVVALQVWHAQFDAVLLDPLSIR